MLPFIKTIFQILIAALLVFGPTNLLASEKSVKKYKHSSKSIKKKIEEKRSDIKAFKKKESSVMGALNDLGVSLNKTGRKVRGIKKELSSLNSRIKGAETRSEELKKKIESREEYASRRLVALYKLNSLGKYRLLASAGSVNEFLQRKHGLELILENDKETLKDLKAKKEELSKLLESLKARRKEKKSLESRLKRQSSDLSRKKKRRQRMLKEIRKDKKQTLAAIKALQKAARKLDDKIKALQLAAKGSKKRKKSSKDYFSPLKGLINMPVQGKITSFFGPYKNTEFNVLNFQNGIDIKAKKGSPITAVCKGKVLYSSWLKGYGNMIILDHGNSFYTVYAHADELLKKTGERARKGETIAYVGDTGSLKGPMLHFEVRHHGKPVNPINWLKKK